MERWQSEAAPIDLSDFNPEDLLGMSPKALAEEISKAVDAEERAKAKRTSGRKGRVGQKRQKYTDLPITRNLIYKILDITDGTVYFCEGIGTTERQVDALLEAGHELKRFTVDKNGDKLKVPRPFQLVLANTGKHGFREFFIPTDQWKRAKIIRDDEVSKLGLVEVRNWPSIPGGFYFQLVRTDGAVLKSTDEDGYYPAMGKQEQQELSMLEQIVQGPSGGTIVWDWLDDRAIPAIVEGVLNCHLSEQARRHLVTVLQQNTTAYPMSPAQASQVNPALADQLKIEKLEEEVQVLRERLESAKRAINQQRGLLGRDQQRLNRWLGSDPP